MEWIFLNYHSLQGFPLRAKLCIPGCFYNPYIIPGILKGGQKWGFEIKNLQYKFVLLYFFTCRAADCALHKTSIQ